MYLSWKNILNTCPPFLNHKNTTSTILLLYYYFYENREEDENDEATLNERRLLSRYSIYIRTVKLLAKGQIISELNFQISQKVNQILNRFLSYEGRAEIVKNLVGFLGDLKTPKFHSEIN